MNENAPFRLDALLEFLKQAGMEGLINPAAARARRKAIEQLAGELTAKERADIRSIDVKSLTSRFHKLEGSSIRPETLEIYLQRFDNALQEYLSWLENPAGFIGARRERARAFMRDSNQHPANVAKREAAERIALEATENPGNIVPVPIRDDRVVYVANLPLDLTEVEASRIARVVRAYAMDRHSNDGREPDGQKTEKKEVDRPESDDQGRDNGEPSA
ncbi:MAG: hypothetical protein RQ741_12275 [Wenzhouxiangellaceae bacterium]|nr:hypothetical protein [Wenzhouxiangellaceae bacterium]